MKFKVKTGAKSAKKQKQNIYCTEVNFFFEDYKIYYVLETNWTKL